MSENFGFAAIERSTGREITYLEAIAEAAPWPDPDGLKAGVYA